MRYVFGFLSVFALSPMLGLACGETAPEPECETTADCDDQNDCTHEHCAGGTCQRTTSYEGQRCDDGDDNECTYGVCKDAVCIALDRGWVDYGTPCESDGVPGVCACGMCGEDLCKGDPCDDGDECTEDWCSPCEGLCWNHPWELWWCAPCDRNGVPGVCFDGKCEEDPCFGVVCDDGDLCTHDECACRDGTCYFPPKGCPIRECYYAGACNPADGSCSYTRMPNGAPCMDGGFWCENGVCVK